MNDEQLTRLLHDAVADVEPTDRLREIRAEARGGARRHRRGWLLSGGGAAIAVAATVAVAVATGTPAQRAGDDPGVANPGSHAAQNPPPTTLPTTPSGPDSTATTDGASAGPGDESHAVAVYYVSGPPERPRLYREFHASRGATPAAVLAALTSAPLDPDYRSTWPDGAFAWAKDGNDLITVDLTDPALRRRPATMSPAEAEASIQQVVYSLQAYAQERLPVRFTLRGQPIDQVLGVPTAEPLANAPILDTLSHVNLTTPEEGSTVTGTLELSGVANSFEANVRWLLEDSNGEDVDAGSITAQGWMAERLFPFEDSIDVSSLHPGRYNVIVYSDDPSGRTDGDRDTRTFVVK